MDLRLAGRCIVVAGIDTVVTAEDYGLLADAILVVHFGIALFVIVGLVAGLAHLSFKRPRWAGSRLFIAAHALTVLIVVLQSWGGVICPLTTWENRLRALAGESVYGESFIAHWLHRLLYYDAEPWVFTLVYTLFGLAATVVWIAIARRWRSQ